MIAFPTLHEEKLLWNSGYEYVIGMDEVGRGAFAGPVTVAGVILPRTFRNPHIHDSKLLTPEKRETLSPYIKQHARHYDIVSIPVTMINAIGIHKATCLAFDMLLSNIFQTIDMRKTYVLLDGRAITGLCCGVDRQKAIIKGDQKSLSIAAASVIAKVARDEYMRTLDKDYPEYLFSSHKGYGTKTHQEMIRIHGLSDMHRTSFDLSAYIA
jgi:ribonuclease HII